MTSPIIDFIEARLAEDEAAARDMPSGNIVDYLALDLKCYSGERTPGDTTEGANILWASIHVGDFAQRWPLLGDFRDRVLREVAAKRAIIKQYKAAIRRRKEQIADTSDWAAGKRPKQRTALNGPDPELIPGLEQAVRHLAAVYSDHESYRKEWAA